jgi:hypothetical protein
MRETRKFWIRLLAALAVALVAGPLPPPGGFRE